MFESISSELFNLIEGCFWVSLGSVCLIVYLKVKTKYKKIALFSAFILITFGISDFLQVVYGSFFQLGLEWLFLWKILDVIGLLIMVVWYFKLRFKNT